MNWFTRGIYFVASLIFVRKVSRIMERTAPWWVLFLLGLLLLVGMIFRELTR